MCLAVPVKITRIEETGLGVVDYLGTEIQTNFVLLPGAKTGDWVIVHAGFAISKLSPMEARETLKLIRQMSIARSDEPR